MRILVSWLRDFVDVPVAPADLATALTQCGFELAALEPVAAPEGAPADAVLDLEITANRPDCLSVIGIAREVAARYDLPLRAPAATPCAADEGRPLPLSVAVEAPDLCPRYAAAMADVRVGASPAWMVDRLAAAGVRSINNVVDVTNYVLVELGHPLHAFDFDRLGGGALRIRRARPGERVTTLDGQDRALGDEMLVIADAQRAQAVAGVMGGGDSEVSASTRVMALESAYFLPSSIRRTSKRLALSTEASYRFERGADPEAPVRAMARALALIERIGAGTARPGWIDVAPAPRARTVIDLRAGRIAHVLGHEVAADEIERILRGLGFDVTRLPAHAAAAPAWRVAVPTWRGDVTREVDLVEEVARHHGYHRLPATFPALAVAPAAPDARLERDRLARRVASALGFSECITFTFIERGAAQPFAEAADIVPIANPLSEKLAVLRPSLLPGVVDSVGHNRRRERRDVQLFENGARFTGATGETRGLALAWTGAGAVDHWTGSGRPVDFFDMKGVVETICAAFGLAPTFEPGAQRWLVPGRAATVAVCGEGGVAIHIGSLGQLVPAMADARGLPPQDEIYVAEIDLDALAPVARLGDDLRVSPLPRHPGVVRDVSLLVDQALPAAALRATIQASAPATLVGVREFARYAGTGVPEGQVSLSFRLTFRAPDRTLTDEEAQRATDGIVAALGAAHGARLR